MSKERYNQIINEVYGKYADSHWLPPENPNGPSLLDQLWSVKPMEHSKESFIQSCKTDIEFSKRWGLKIEERELSLDERMNLYFTQHPEWAMIGKHSFFDNHNIPTKLTTVTYNNETIEIYE